MPTPMVGDGGDEIVIWILKSTSTVASGTYWTASVPSIAQQGPVEVGLVGQTKGNADGGAH